MKTARPTHSVALFALPLLALPAQAAIAGWLGLAAVLAALALPAALAHAPLLLLRARRLAPGEAPELRRELRTLALRARLAEPRLYWIASDTPNAFVCGGAGSRAALAVTRGLLALLDPPERMAVLAHELGHLDQRRRDRRPRLPALPLLAGFVRTALLMSAGEGALRRTLARPLILLHAWLGRRALSDARELAADAYAARLCGDPRWLADALRKIQATQAQSPNAPHRTANAPHPPVQERIRRLEAMTYGAYL